MTEKVSMFWSFNKDVCGAMNVNQYTIGAHSASENAWGNANLKLNDNWLHSNPDPDTGAHTKAYDDVQAIAYAGDKSNPNYNLDTQREMIDDMITNSDGNNDFANVPQWSMQLIIQLQGLVGNCYNKDDDSSLQSSAVQQQGSLVQSDMAKGVSTSDSETKALSNLIGGDSSAITPQSDAGTAVSGVFGNSANAQASISA